MRRTLVVALLAVAACSSVIVTPGPSDEGAYLDEGATAEEVDGLLVQCGNELDANYYWMVHAGRVRGAADYDRLRPRGCRAA
jgi:hypothetical protein